MAENILNEGREALLRIYSEVMELSENEAKEKELVAEEDEYEKKLEAKEKAVAKEITDTLKKRREEVIKTFDIEEEKLNAIVKKTSQKREKYRSGKVSERIQSETADFIEANEQIKADIKKLYKQTKTPGFFNLGLYYMLFMPKGIKDFFGCFITFLLLFAGVPALIWHFLPKPAGPYLIGIIYVACIVIFGGLYMMIFTASRTKYREVAAAGSNARAKIKNNKKVIAKISRNILKDKDDSGYGLEDYNSKLEDLRIRLEDLAARKREAVRVFDESTKKAVTDEIRNINQAEINGYKEKLTEITDILSELRDYIEHKKIYIAEKYEVFLGKENVAEGTLKALIAISENNKEASISELIEMYKEEAADNVR